MKIKLILAAWLLTLAVQAQTAHKYLRKGDSAYENGSFSDAEVNYRKALEEKNTTQGKYNLGNSTYRQKRYDEAIKHFESAAAEATDPQTKARAFHNLGNSYFQKGKLPESIDAYKSALRLNPSDLDTKRNLANALRRQQQQNQEQNQQQQQQDQQKNQQEGNPPPNPEQEQQPGEGQEDENQQDQQDQPSSGSQGQPENLSKEEARQLLEIMDREEQKVQQKLRKAQSGNKKVKKDW